MPRVVAVYSRKYDRLYRVGRWSNVCFGSLADICTAKGHVRFAPNSDRESGFPQTLMSALPPKADMDDVLTLIDHFIRACEYRQRQCEAEFLGNLEVDSQLKSGGLLHGQVGWPGAFEDLVDVGRSSPKQVRRVRPVGQKRSGVHQPARHSNEDELVLFDEIPDSLPV